MASFGVNELVALAFEHAAAVPFADCVDHAEVWFVGCQLWAAFGGGNFGANDVAALEFVLHGADEAVVDVADAEGAFTGDLEVAVFFAADLENLDACEVVFDKGDFSEDDVAFFDFGDAGSLDADRHGFGVNFLGPEAGGANLFAVVVGAFPWQELFAVRKWRTGLHNLCVHSVGTALLLKAKALKILGKYTYRFENELYVMSGEELWGALSRLGEKRIEAAVLSVLFQDSPATTKEIMEQTGLRQPEVSMGVRALAGRGWVSVDQIPREGKGRPMNEYRLMLDALQLHAFYQREAAARRQEITDAESLIQDRVKA